MENLLDVSSLIIQFINFAIIAYVLRRFFFLPYLRYIDEEKKKRKELEEQLEKSAFILTDAHNQADNIISQARVDAKMVSLEIIELARKDAKDITTKAHRDADQARSKGFADIELERKALEAEMKKRVLDVALALNKKIFGETSEAHKSFLSQHVVEASGVNH